MSVFLVFQQFETIEEAARVASILEASGFEVVVDKESALLDTNIIGTNYRPLVNLKLNGEDFDKARALLSETADKDLEEVAEDYMLLSFSNEELMDVIAKPDEWGYYNYNIATALLKKRGATVSAELKEKLEKERITELSQQDRMSPFLILLGYAIPFANVVYFLVHVSEYFNKQLMWWLFPGLGGFLIGAVLKHSRRTLPNGKSMPVYRSEDRKHGPTILYINSTVFLANFALFIIYVIMY